MIALWILGILAALLGLLCCVPVGITGEYSQIGASVKARIGPFSVRVYPRPTKTSTKKGRKKQEKDAPKKIEKSKQEQPKSGGSLPPFRELVGMLLEIQEDLRNHLLVRELVLRLRIGGKNQDPAQSAVLYGSAWAALGNLTTLLQRAFRIRHQDTRAEIDFLEESTTVYAKADLTMTVGAILRMGGYYGIRGLKLYRTHMKKGGSEYGTSN